MRKGVQTLSTRDASTLADEVYRFVLDQLRDNPDAVPSWNNDIGADLWLTLPLDKVDWSAGDRLIGRFVPTKPFERAAMIASCERTADALLSKHGLRVVETDREKLVRATASAIQQASLTARAVQKPIFCKLAGGRSSATRGGNR